MEATISSIVSTPLGKMARTTSPRKPPRQQVPPADPSTAGVGPGTGGAASPAGATPTPGMLRGLSVLNVAATPPLASATQQPLGGLRQPGSGGGGQLLAAPDGEASRVVAAPELLPAPYTQRLLRPPLAPPAGGTAGEEGQATLVAASSGNVTSAGEPEAGDGMEGLAQEVRAHSGCEPGRAWGGSRLWLRALGTDDPPPLVRRMPTPQAARLRFGRDLRLAEVRRLLRSSAPVPLRMGGVPEPSDAGVPGGPAQGGQHVGTPFCRALACMQKSEWRPLLCGACLRRPWMPALSPVTRCPA